MSYQQHPGASDQPGRRQAPPYPALLGTNGAPGGRAPAAGVYGMPQYTQVGYFLVCEAKGAYQAYLVAPSVEVRALPYAPYVRARVRPISSLKPSTRFCAPLILSFACSHLHVPA